LHVAVHNRPLFFLQLRGGKWEADKAISWFVHLAESQKPKWAMMMCEVLTQCDASEPHHAQDPAEMRMFNGLNSSKTGSISELFA